MPGFENEPSRLIRQLDLEAHAARQFPAGSALRAHCHQSLDPPLIPRPPRLDALPQPCLLPGEALVELLLLQGLVGEPLFFLALKRLVIARPRCQGPAIEFDDSRSEPPEKSPIVRDEQDGSRIILQEKSRAR